MKNLKSFQKLLAGFALFSFVLYPGSFLYAKPAEIVGIEFKQVENAFDILINGQGNLRYTASFLRNPRRIELLFVDTKFRLTQSIPTAENDFVAEVVATMLTSPDTDKTAKITIDLKGESQYSIEGATEGIVIHLFNRPESTAESEAETTEAIDPPVESKSEDIWAQIQKQDEQADTEKVETPADSPATDTPKAENPVDSEQVDTPSDSPEEDTPDADNPEDTEKVDPQIDSPEVNPPTDSPKVDPPMDSPKVDPQIDSPEVNPPTDSPKVDLPEDTPNVDTTLDSPKVDTSAVPPKQPEAAKDDPVETAKGNSSPGAAKENERVVTAANVTPDPSTDELVIGAEDLLQINVFQLPEFSLEARVLGDGTITMPLVGAIKLSGLTRQQAEAEISRALTAKDVNRPSVSVTIKEYKSRQVSVLGSVRSAGIYFLTSERRLLQLLSEAGGLAPDAGTTCYIFRAESKIMVDLHDLMQNGNQSLNIQIQPGDVINVPSLIRSFVYVLGAVRSPGAVELIPSVGLNLAGAIARAGGPSRLADLSDIQIIRKENGTERVIKVNLKDILKNKVPDVTLLADDLINVPESFF